MSLDAGSEAGVIGVGVAVLLGSATGVVKAASLRGDINSRWTRRVQFAIAALDEKTFNELDRLHAEIDDILPSDFDPDFDPAAVITDPAPITRRAGKTAAYYRARTRMELDLVRLRRLGPVAVAALSVFALAAALITIYYAQLLRLDLLRLAGFLLLGISLVVLIPSTIVYAVLEHRLTSGEILAGTGGRAEQDGAT